MKACNSLDYFFLKKKALKNWEGRRKVFDLRIIL
jgi:hypothetical protein